jgi:uncharacterized protein with GYD domain
MVKALRDGFRSIGRNYGLVLAVLATNVALALLLAAPLALRLGNDLRNRGASVGMLYGFDYDWWSQWSDEQQGYARSFAPDILGRGFAVKSLDLLLKGDLPAGLFSRGEPDTEPLILGVGALYLLVQVFLTGGLLGVFRAPQGGWTVRGLLHGSGFYFGRLVRVSLLSLALAGLVFALNAPFARWIDGRAREAVSERTAIALTLGRHALLLVVLLLVHMVSSYAKVIVVLEERLSAVLAFLSSLGFCARNFFAAFGQYVVVVGVGLVLLAVFSALDSRLGVVGWKTQLVALALFQAFLAARIAVRLGLLASQLELSRGRGR